MPSIDFTALQALCPLPVVLDYLGWSPTTHERAGLRGWCPIHSARPHDTRTFSVSYKGEWYCHSCKRGGDGLLLFALVTGLPLFEACHVLASALRIPMPYLGGRKKRTRSRNGEEATYGGGGGASPPQITRLTGEKYHISPLPCWWPI